VLQLEGGPGSLAERLAVQERLEPPSSRVLGLESKLFSEPSVPLPRGQPHPVFVLTRPETDATQILQRTNFQGETGETSQTTRNDEAVTAPTLGPEILNVFKLTLQEEQRLLAAEPQRRKCLPAATAGTGSTSSVLRAPVLQPLVATTPTPSREQSEDLVDMLKRAYEKPGASTAMSLTMQPNTVQEGEVFTM